MSTLEAPLVILAFGAVLYNSPADRLLGAFLIGLFVVWLVAEFVLAVWRAFGGAPRAVKGRLVRKRLVIDP